MNIVAQTEDLAPIEALLRRAGLAGTGEPVRFEPLEGGVSSAIWRVPLAREPVCVKRALARLKVAGHWEAPLERNRHERRWMAFAAGVAAEAVPRLLAEGEDFFVMEYLDPARHPNWKERLRDGAIDEGFAGRVGALLARLHAAGANDAARAAEFANDAAFHALRIEPYLLATAAAHPALAGRLRELARATAETRRCVVHGDVSPKNILCGPRGPVMLDAECAWYGEPAFDLAFCLNHLLLKCLWRPQHRARYLRCYDALAGAYLAGAGWEDSAGLEARTARLLPALLLARVDGKSPAEYLTETAARDKARRVASALIESPAQRLDTVRAHCLAEFER